MQEESRAQTSGVKRLIYFVVVVLALAGAYQGVMWGFRVYTSSRIQDVVGKEIPDFELTDTQGRLVTKSSLLGKTVILNFFRSNCHGCQEEQGDIRRLAREIDPERATLVGVMVDRVQGFPQSATDRTLAEFRYQHPIVMADSTFVDAFHGVGWSHITPITYVADERGIFVASFRHPYDIEGVLELLE